MSSVLTQLQRRVEPALPGRDYHDSGVFELERRRIFHRKWFCVGREEQAPLRGDFFVIDVIDESILVVRATTWFYERSTTSAATAALSSARARANSSPSLNVRTTRGAMRWTGAW